MIYDLTEEEENVLIRLGKKIFDKRITHRTCAYCHRQAYKTLIYLADAKTSISYCGQKVDGMPCVMKHHLGSFVPKEYVDYIVVEHKE